MACATSAMHNEPSDKVKAARSLVEATNSPEPSDPDRPLTVPLLVRGSLIHSGFLVPGFLALVFFGLALSSHRSIRNFPEHPHPAWIFLILGGIPSLIATAVAYYLTSRRLWLEVTVHGFVFRGRRCSRTFRDHDVRGFSQYWQAWDIARTATVTLDVEATEGSATYLLTYVVWRWRSDPLAVLWTRLERNVARVAWERRASSAALVGDGWRLGEGNLWRTKEEQGRDLASITLVGDVNRNLCVWFGSEADPWFRMPVGEHNIGALRMLLGKHTSPLGGAVHNLGRRLFSRLSRPRELAIVLGGIGWLFLFIIGMEVLEGRLTKMIPLALLYGLPLLTRQSRKRKTAARMAFIRQNGWLSRQPAWGECHVSSMAVPDQVRQPHCLHPALF